MNSGAEVGGGELGFKGEAGAGDEARGSTGDGAGRHKRNGSVSGAPGHSPSFASLADVSSVEGRPVPSRSESFQGFDSPKQGGEARAESPLANLAGASSPSAPAALTPVIGNVDSFTFKKQSRPPGAYVTPMKIPGYELLSYNASEAGTLRVSSPGARSAVRRGSDVASPAEEVNKLSGEPAHGAPVLVPAAPPAGLDRERDTHDAPRLAAEESVATVPAAAAAGTVDGHTSADVSTTTEKAVDASNEAPGSEGRIEEVAGKASTGDGIETTHEKEAGSVQPAETIAFRNVEAEKEAPTSVNTGASKPVLTMVSTKKWRPPSDAEIKAMMVIPEYLSKDMEDAVKTKGEAIPQGPPAGETIEAPACPILVFINSRSGGRLGVELLKHFEELISSYQVYDLAKHSPSAVLQYGIGCLHRMANSGDECARKTREGLRILVAGGDGTVGWVLSSVGALRELLGASSIIPPVAVLPLGTGNDLARSFGWGGDFSSTSKSALKKVLAKTFDSKAAPLDTWTAVVVPAKSVAQADILFPHAMHPQHHVPLPSSVIGEKHEKDERDPSFEGLFFNYFSIGMDAQVAYGFHHLRDDKPWLARGRAANQMIYSSFGCTQGWFCTACSLAPRARGVSNIMTLWVRKRGSKDWQDIHLPSNIRAIVICNLKSYAGGRNPWGKPSSDRREKEGLSEQRCDDGLLEIMGLKDGWHSAFVLLEIATAVRLGQAEAVKLELNGKARKKAYLQMDGEPWLQPMGRPDDGPTVVIIDKLPHPSLLLKR